MKTKTLGFPRVGGGRELKQVIEGYFRGQHPESRVHEVARFLRRRHYECQKDAGIDWIPSSDFSLYDHVLDTARALGAAPVSNTELTDTEETFLLSRGSLPATEGRAGVTARALEMTKWFDTNYHHLVPEITDKTTFALRKNIWLEAYEEARGWGFQTQPVLLGPVSFLLLSKNPIPDGNPPLGRLSELLPLYARILSELFEQGAEWVQLDEPCLTLDLAPEHLAAFERSLRFLGERAKRPRLLLTTYFSSLAEQIPWIGELPLDGLHLDLCSAPEQIDAALDAWPKERVLSLGLVDGRNVWRCDAAQSEHLIARAREVFADEQLVISTSCSLLHCPLDLDLEAQIPAEVRLRLAFAKQKLAELERLGRFDESSRAELRASSKAADEARTGGSLAARISVQTRVAATQSEHFRRSLPYAERSRLLREENPLPPLPTTTIGSFPQTNEIRKKRALFRSGRLNQSDYERFIDRTIAETIAVQEKLGLDVVVHGEAERNDMVEFFSENLHGFLSTEHGWVQSYGTRCVKPPIIYGDIERKRPLTLREMRVARQATKKPLKGMLTGPITMLKWSFVRQDQPLRSTALQMAWALRDEIDDLQREGLTMIQVDEPALREGLPLKKEARDGYLRTAIDAFGLATGGASARTQIHTHMCYAEFSDVMDAIIALDADVISIESARSRTELLGALGDTPYPNEIGPGVFDIHSPRIPSIEEMVTHLRGALGVVPAERLWVNPDCGLKTRSWEEVDSALRHMVTAAHIVRRALDTPSRTFATDA